MGRAATTLATVTSIVALLGGCQGSPTPVPDPPPTTTSAPSVGGAAGPTATATSTAAPSASALSVKALSVTALRAKTPKAGEIHRLTGYVVKRYRCPPCPPGAHCKPCMGNNVVVSDDATLHEQYDLDERDVIVFLDDPMSVELGETVTLTVRVLDRQASNEGIPDLELVP